ncbi:hypothetical protein [Paenibacillus sp. SI8]|uniref:hypothetical protein n=1 Tax=unclassified Paenibacillus TaxID=185978 RepID=UPI003464E8F4
MTISIVTGLPGFGKTLKLCEFGIRAMAAGKHVYANFPMWNFPDPKFNDLYHRYNDPIEVLSNPDIKNSLILMSEVNILLSLRKMYQIPDHLWDDFRQHRKDGNNIMADAQDMIDVAWMFKNLIQYQYHIYMKLALPKKRDFLNGRAFQLVRVKNPQPKGMDYGRRYWVYNPVYFNYYDTNFKLEKSKKHYDTAQEIIQSPWADYEREQYSRLLFTK